MDKGLIFLWLLVVVGGALVLYALDRLGLWMESRGLLYYRRSGDRVRPSLGGAFLQVQSFIEPAAKHVLEETLREEKEEAEAGDPPEPGAAGRIW